MADARLLKGVLKQERIALVVFGVENHLGGLNHREMLPSPSFGKGCAAAGCSPSLGRANSNQNVLPLPGSDSTPTLPPIRSAAFFTMARPMPVPSYLWSRR